MMIRVRTNIARVSAPFIFAACAAAPPPLPSDAARHDVPPGPGYGAEQARLELRLEERETAIVLELGPVDVPGGHTMVKTPLLSAELPVSAWLTGFEVELVDAAGNRLPQTLLHHVNVLLPDRRDLFRPIMQRLAAAGEETEAITIPWPFGVPAAAHERVAVYAMLHSDDRAYGNVTLRMRVHYDTGRRRAVQPFFMDASPPPGPAGWDVPPGRSERVWEGSPAVDGRLLGVGGHLHRYGTELILEDATSGRELFRLRPTVADDGSIDAVERRTFITRLGVPLRAHHRYRIIARYDNPTGDTIRAAGMGTIGGMILPSRQRWPRPDPAHALYRDDVRILTAGEAPHVH